MEKPTVERYRVFLDQIYRFEAPVEAACVATSGLDRGLLRTHLKASNLVADLDALGLAPSEAQPLATVHFDSPAEALAWMWVLHRNTLLHGLIYRYVRGRLGDSLPSAGSYLTAFEGRAGALMRDLGDALDAAAKRPAISATIVAAANDAFRAQRQWYSCDQLTPRRPPLPRTTTPRQAA